MLEQKKKELEKMATAIRVLSMDAVEKANSGHPGLPLGCAEIGAYLFGKAMRHNPANPDWLGRDRFCLSAGHGSMLLYSCLHLTGYDLPLEQLKQFRQLGSMTPGHPEYGVAPGVETTTGPLGQGFANGVGMALANKMVRARFGLEKTGLLDGMAIVLSGDGCMMEGITSEAASFAGHHKLDNLVVFYDSNDICLDGPTSECFTEDTAARYRAYGWAVEEIDGNDLDQIDKAFTAARERTDAPTMIIAHTIIGKGSPNKAGTSSAHGAPLGDDEITVAKQGLGVANEPFAIPEEAKAFADKCREAGQKMETEWNTALEGWKNMQPEKGQMFEDFIARKLPEDFDEKVRAIEIKADQASRKSSSAVLQELHDLVPFLVGGSADLSCSDNTMMKKSGIISPDDFSQRNIKWGVREFAMSAATNGIALHKMLRPYCGTFLTFSDYMRNAIRLASIMKIPTIYQFTHDSIGVGEDGPTHQPVEHVPSLRAIPNLTVIRPADANEVKAAWSWTLRHNDGPTAIILTRQSLPDMEATNVPTADGVGRGAYVIKTESGDKADFCLMASGSEVKLALDTAAQLEEKGKSVRVVSVPSFEIFDAQNQDYRESVMGGDVDRYVSIEAQVETGWHKYIGRKGIAVSMTTFGTSAPGKEAMKHFGFTPEAICERLGC
ncbi:MAG: transketolase [Candidatus Sumerlaeota bacterium]